MEGALGVFWRVVVPVFLVATTGYALGKSKEISPETISRIVFYILGPALIFVSIYKLTIDASGIWRMFWFSLVYAIAMLAISWVIALALGYPQKLASAFVLVGFLVNSGNFGLPLNLFAFGEEGLQWAVIFYLTNSILSNSLGVFIAARGKQSSLNALKSVLEAPVIYTAALAGLLRWQGWQIPGPIFKAFDLAGKGAIPVMLVLLGVQLSRVKLDRDLKALSTATVVRMGIGPAVAIALAAVFGLTGLARKAGIVEASMPVAVYTTILTSEFDVYPEFAAGSVLVTTLVSMVSVTALLSWLG
jgi:predicted permease